MDQSNRPTCRDLADLPPTITVEHAGRILGLGRSAAYDAIHRGTIPAIRVGRRVLVPTHALMRMLDALPLER